MIQRPSYGYELAHRFDDAYGDALKLSGSSYVYTALDALLRRSMIEEIPGTRAARQPRPRYRSTDSGVLRYKKRLVADIHEERRRSRLFARELAAFAHEPQEALEIIEQAELLWLEEAASSWTSRSLDESPRDVVSGLASRLASEERRLAMEAKLPWVKFARDEFRALAEDKIARQ